MERLFSLARSLTAIAENICVLSTSVTDGLSGQQNSRGVRHRAKAALNRALAQASERFASQGLARSLTSTALDD